MQRLGQEAVICTVIAVYHGLSVEKLRSWNELRIKGNEVLECIEYYRYKEKVSKEERHYLYDAERDARWQTNLLCWSGTALVAS